jgi:hypothetical protein
MEYKFTIEQRINTCQYCPCLDDEYCMCKLANEEVGVNDLFKSKPEWCPLQEVKNEN